MTDSKKAYKLDFLMGGEYWTHWATYDYEMMALEVVANFLDNKEITDFRLTEVKRK